MTSPTTGPLSNLHPGLGPEVADPATAAGRPGHVEKGSFGRGLLLDDGDLVFGRGDLVEVTGVANLAQALTLRVLTPLGSDRFNPGYGLDVTRAFTAANSARMVKELLKLNLVGTLGADPRVGEVRQVTFDDDPERLAADPAAAGRARTAQIRRTWNVTADLDTVAGVPVTLQVNVEV